MDLSMMESIVVGSILVPAIVAMFKTQIAQFFDDYTVYKNRMFDADGDPGTGEYCYLQNKTTGKFVKLMVFKYEFSFWPSKRLVWVLWPAPSGEEGKVIIVPYTYSQWANIQKGSLEKDLKDVLKEGK